ncbi:NUDIX hydrolase [Fervidibacter sacchari]|uniref:ADP-ribose pyrophosphatase n=1 Tax=Candidatus Fervidibacter sacchari TaxID=1448929 RepID=A0ABT2EJV0_9BACT|nr:NUDIX hydrolase [Candidatus Fervidibacter sacchari]MCS3918229.1 ADP-ribose pyrophosphatase [Candidatus Fervidibacter sacchari]WKU16033.1 NUDIX hydrolase [Candidatus Fervidibacter sacchari]
MTELTEVLIESDKVFEGRLISVRKDTVRLPNGRTSTREVVVHPGAVAVVPMLEDGRVILVKQYRHAVGKILMEIPAGTLYPDETPEECALRELREEVGYAAGRLEKLTSVYLAPGYSTELIHLFLATDLQPAEGETDEDEFLKPVTLTLDEAVAQIANGEIQDAKTVAALLLVWSKQISRKITGKPSDFQEGGK